ncbi:hypothetical protein Aperf_G00000038630 [Anoplocephala perfoliata]
MRAEVEKRSHKERPNNGRTANANFAGKTGFVSQQKLTQILGKSEQVQDTSSKSRYELSQQTIPRKPAESDCNTSILQSSNLSSSTDETIEEAVHKLIDINKDKLTESQLVDLISSFYLVTNQCLRKCKANSAGSTECTSVKLQRAESVSEGRDEFSQSQNECTDNKQIPISLSRPLSLLERKRLQWMQEKETEHLKRNRVASAMDCKSNGAINLGEVQKSAPTVRDYHRFQRRTYIGSLAVGGDPQAEAEFKEQQRRQWLAELDQQVEERRLARERERLKRLEWESTPIQTDRESSNDVTKVEPSLTASAYNDVKSTSYGRGRGLADLMGLQNLNSATKRQQQQELKEAYAEQIREREKRRQLEREAEARAEAAVEEAARLEVERTRLQEEQEFELAQRRRQVESEAAKQVTMKGAQEKAARKVDASEDVRKHPQANSHRSSRDVSRIPRPSNRASSQQRNRADEVGKLKKAQFGSTYTISKSTGKACGGNEARSRIYIHKETPMMVRTESTLLPSTPPPPPLSASSHRPTSDFLAAVADPDFAHPQASRDSALREVSRIKENLALRQNELRSMQQNS